MTLTQLHYVLTIAETGSFNKAAQILYVSQPSLSNAIHDLEDEFSITIFYRSGRGVTLTNEGVEFIAYARQVYHQYESLLDKFGKNGTLKKKFGVSTQHYSFATKSFVEMVKKFNTAEYDFAIRETKTREVIDDVSTQKSEIGILYLSSFNKNIITKLLNSADLEFHHIIDCRTFVYLYKDHPLASREYIEFKDLSDYPCLSFEQGDNSSFYFAEEIFSTKSYIRTVKVNDRASMLNLMRGLNGFTLCSGIICEALNGDDYIAVPYKPDESEDDVMDIGYIVKKNQILSKMGQLYIEEIHNYFRNATKNTDVE
ncbi:LysR family transcriptional regulator [Succinivibrio dextrinosolvens]|jgi:DNA-binding transcriptional LysR family regulator|uniref:DNA-binding transcriptional regulator, LysR family n=1 Tax=Succinivibrio dextrinosolvens DSM 3072 TaxID=1123324 RepID=A0A1T4VM43_9GAMM|nr:LysR family transcriptional regulator [Succinivibrio dextrinosolvens]MBE6422983.1 LysR family transcriptional regulator [Succinivibrio dextrinosolvens]SKA66020.1 DNA-binding transcriptional regulator, LysR family [Succinivibrio dextrinosolvens DSM 3072]